MTTYSETIQLVTGDTLPALSVTLRDSNSAASGRTLDASDPTSWAPISITGASISMFVRPIGSTTLSGTVTGSVIDGSNGVVAFIFANTVFPDAGAYEGEIQITFSGGGIQTLVELIKFKVRADFT
jgi:hypothetical protein